MWLSVEYYTDIDASPLEDKIAFKKAEELPEPLRQKEFPIHMKVHVPYKASIGKLQNHSRHSEQSEYDSNLSFKPFFLIGHPQPSRCDNREENKSLKVPLVAGKLTVDTDDIFVCVDFGMSNTCVAIYAPGMQRELDDLKDYFLPFKIDLDLKVLPTLSKSLKLISDPSSKIAASDISEEAPPSLSISQLGNDKDLFIELKTQIEAVTSAINSMAETIRTERTVFSTEKVQKTNLIVFDRDEVINKHLEESPVLREPQDKTLVTGYDSFQRYVKNSKKYYSDSVLESVWSAYRSPRSLVILAGPTGTGKTTLVKLLADFLNFSESSSTSENPFYRLEPVSPTWFSPQSLLGAYNALDGHFYPTNFLEFMLIAERNHKRWGDEARVFFACLDEFNIAQPEQYFANVLSIMESDSKVLDICHQVSLKICLTPNLKVFGTINTDVSSKILSKKVLDRATYIRIAPTKAHILDYFNILVEKANKADNYSLLQVMEEFKLKLDSLCDLGEIAQSPIGYRSIDQVLDTLRYHPYVSEEEVELDKSRIKRVVDAAVCAHLLAKLPGLFSSDNQVEYKKKLNYVSDLFDGQTQVRTIIQKILQGYPGQSAT